MYFRKKPKLNKKNPNPTQSNQKKPKPKNPTTKNQETKVQVLKKAVDVLIQWYFNTIKTLYKSISIVCLLTMFWSYKSFLLQSCYC